MTTDPAQNIKKLQVRPYLKERCRSPPYLTITVVGVHKRYCRKLLKGTAGQ